MYQKPSLKRLGSFREITRGGGFAWALDFAADGWREFLLHETPTAS
ncbi:MAG TPA: lasso RiPP family leader peptide-containing protein [Longimicrobiales bacterium]|nr:lasso RiPP family leader peptide-containing protein [Longimicrobiales bacterium]